MPKRLSDPRSYPKDLSENNHVVVLGWWLRLYIVLRRVGTRALHCVIVCCVWTLWLRLESVLYFCCLEE